MITSFKFFRESYQAPKLLYELETHSAKRYCLNCRTDRSLSHHAVQCVLPDQPDLCPAPAIPRRGIMRRLTPWPRHHLPDGRLRCASSPPRLAFQPVASDWLEPWPVSPRQCAPSCWPPPPWPAGPGGVPGYSSAKRRARCASPRRVRPSTSPQHQQLADLLVAG